MAIQRQYQGTDFGMRDSRQITGTQVAGPGRSAGVQRVGDDQWQARMLSNLGQGAARTFDQLADLAHQDAYLKGQVAAGTGAVEEDLQGDPITRDWAVAGFRDTMGKLALADVEAQFQTDLKSLRTQDPDKLEEYLTARRNELTPAIAGMSRNARGVAAGNLLMQDRAAIKQYGIEHQKYIVETILQADATKTQTALDSMSAVRLGAMMNDPKSVESFNAQKDSALTTFASPWLENSYPLELQQELTYRKLSAALGSDNVALYEDAQRVLIPDGQGGQTTLKSRLPYEQQQKLDAQYREAYNRTSNERNVYRAMEVADVKSQIAAGTLQDTPQQFALRGTQWVLNKTMTADEWGSIYKSYLDMNYKSEEDTTVSQMFTRGDLNGLNALEKSPKQAADATVRMMAKRGVPPATQLQVMLSAGSRGMDAGYNKAGEFMGTALQQIKNNPQEVLPQHRAVFEQVYASLSTANNAGNGTARVAILSGLNEDQRMFAERVLASRDGGASVEEAVVRATKQEELEVKLSPSARAGMAGKDRAALDTAINNIDARGWFTTKTNQGLGFVGSSGAEQKLALQPFSAVGSRDGWFSDSATVQFYTKQSRDEVRAEAHRLLNLHPGTAVDSVINTAKANVTARTIQTNNGPVTFPANMDFNTVFGVTANNKAAIGPAIDNLLKSVAPDSRWQMTFANGRLFAQEFDKSGQRVGNGRYIEGEVAAQVQRDYTNAQDKANMNFGTGKQFKVGDAVIRFNGNNSAGVQNAWMFQFRENLTKHEGGRDVPYADLSGNVNPKTKKPIQTVGVGVSDTNDFYPEVGKDGKVSAENLQLSFLKASDAAARTGAQVSRELGLNNAGAFMLFSEIAYQSGTGFHTRKDDAGAAYQAFIGTMRGTSPEMAKAAFRQTAAWKYSADPKDRNKVTKRQQSYLNLIDQAMKG